MRAGDTLWDIAKRHGISVQALLAANPQITDPRAIHVGEEITISPIDLGTLGGAWSEAVAINDRGQVVGAADTASGERHGFLWQDGSMIDLGTLGGRASAAVNVNGLGEVVGWSEVTATGADSDGSDSPPRHAFLWRGGTMTDLGTLGGDSSEAVAINARGQIVGTSSTATGAEHVFLWQAGTMTDIGPPGEVHGAAVAINDSGQIAIVRVPGAAVAINNHGQVVGGRYLSDLVLSGGIFLWQDDTMTDLGPLEEEAFSWRDGTMTALGSLGQGATVAVAVNSRGQVVGSSLTNFADPVPWEWCCSTLFHAFVWQDGAMVDMGDLGTVATRTSSDAAAINDCGQVVGSSALDPSLEGRAAAHAALWYTETK